MTNIDFYSTFNLLAAGTVEKYTFEKNKWFSFSSLPQKLRSVSSCVDESLYPNEVLYVLGGIDVTNQEVSDVIYFHHNVQGHDNWIVCGKLCSPRYRHTSAIYQGLIWSVGGVRNDNESLYVSYFVSIFLFHFCIVRVV